MFLSLHRDEKICSFEYLSAKPSAVDLERLGNGELPWFTFGESIQCDGTGCFRYDFIDVNEQNCQYMFHNNNDDIQLSVLYEMKPYYQNHRSYVYSRSLPQLQKGVWGSEDDLSACAGAKTLNDLIAIIGVNGIKERGLADLSIYKDVDYNEILLYPCGLQSISLFNDSYRFYDDDLSEILLEESINLTSQTDIAKGVEDLQNIPTMLVPEKNIEVPRYYLSLNTNQFKRGVEDKHFLNWIRLSPTSVVRKLWARGYVKGNHMPRR